MQVSTYFLAVRLLDRVLSQQAIKRSKFQLLGCACLMIAGKLEEIEAPSIENLIYLSDNGFNTESLINMEMMILKMLNFKVSIYTSHHFATRLALAAHFSEKEKEFMLYLLEISLYDFNLSHENYPSKIVAAAAHLTIQALRPIDAPVWSKTLEYYSGGYRDCDPSIRSIILTLRALHWNVEKSSYKGINKKFEKPSRLYVSLIGAVKLSDIRYTVEKNKVKETEEVKEKKVKVIGEGDIPACDEHPSSKSINFVDVGDVTNSSKSLHCIVEPGIKDVGVTNINLACHGDEENERNQLIFIDENSRESDTICQTGNVENDNDDFDNNSNTIDHDTSDVHKIPVEKTDLLIGVDVSVENACIVHQTFPIPMNTNSRFIRGKRKRSVELADSATLVLLPLPMRPTRGRPNKSEGDRKGLTDGDKEQEVFHSEIQSKSINKVIAGNSSPDVEDIINRYIPAILKIPDFFLFLNLFICSFYLIYIYAFSSYFSLQSSAFQWSII